METEVEVGEYKGNDMLIIYELDDKGTRKPYPFQFGTKKAEMIVENIERIKEFLQGAK